MSNTSPQPLTRSMIIKKRQENNKLLQAIIVWVRKHPQNIHHYQNDFLAKATGQDILMFFCQRFEKESNDDEEYFDPYPSPEEPDLPYPDDCIFEDEDGNDIGPDHPDYKRLIRDSFGCRYRYTSGPSMDLTCGRMCRGKKEYCPFHDHPIFTTTGIRKTVKNAIKDAPAIILN